MHNYQILAAAKMYLKAKTIYPLVSLIRPFEKVSFFNLAIP